MAISAEDPPGSHSIPQDPAGSRRRVPEENPHPQFAVSTAVPSNLEASAAISQIEPPLLLPLPTQTIATQPSLGPDTTPSADGSGLTAPSDSH